MGVSTDRRGFSSGSITESNASRLTAMLDAQDAMAGIVALRESGQSWLADRITVGSTLVDVGCGTATDLIAAASGPPLGGKQPKCVGLDASKLMLSIAEDRARQAGGASAEIRFTKAEVERLPLADSEADAVCCERVLQHVRDPKTAVSEIRRVLTPGGRFVISDTDWSTMRLYTGDPDMDASIASLLARSGAGGSSARHPRIGAELPELLEKSGLTVEQTETATLDDWPPDILTMGAAVTIDQGKTDGAISPSEAEQLSGAITADNPDLRMEVTMTQCRGRRPTAYHLDF